MSSQAPQVEAPGFAFGGALRALAVVGPPITIATALLFYFGWALTAAQSRAMGVDESIFAMSTRDYVLRSLSALYVPLIAGSAVLLLWVVLHGWLLDLLAKGRAIPVVRRSAQVVAWSAWWFLPTVGAFLALVRPAWGDLSVPLSFALGFLLSSYGARIRDLAGDAEGRPRTQPPPWVGYLHSVLIGVLVTAALFWTVANFAGVVGRGKAELVAASANSYPTVKVYSQRDLHLDVAGVDSVAYQGSDTDYRFVYSGFHLLQRTGEKFFLVPPNWAPGSAPLIVLRDDATIRLEFTGSGT